MYILRRSANDETKWQQDDRGKKPCSFSVNPDDKRTEKPAKNQNPEREREIIAEEMVKKLTEILYFSHGFH